MIHSKSNRAQVVNNLIYQQKCMMGIQFRLPNLNPIYLMTESDSQQFSLYTGTSDGEPMGDFHCSVKSQFWLSSYIKSMVNSIGKDKFSFLIFGFCLKQVFKIFAEDTTFKHIACFSEYSWKNTDRYGVLINPNSCAIAAQVPTFICEKDDNQILSGFVLVNLPFIDKVNDLLRKNDLTSISKPSFKEIY